MQDVNKAIGESFPGRLLEAQMFFEAMDDRSNEGQPLEPMQQADETNALKEEVARLQEADAGFKNRVLTIALLATLYRHSDEVNGLTYDEILDHLGKDFGIKSCKVTMAARLKDLEAFNPLPWKVQRLKAGDEDVEKPGVAIRPPLDAAQMRLLIDGLLCSRADADELADLVTILAEIVGVPKRVAVILESLGLASGAEKGSDGKRKGASGGRTEKGFFVNIEAIDEAISAGRPITCCYTDWTAEGTLEPRQNPDGSPRKYTLDPYRLAYKNGRYFLICRKHGSKAKRLSYFRVDRMKDVKVKKRMRVSDIAGALPNGRAFDLAEHMGERPYPWSGEAVRVTVRTAALDVVFDWFNVESCEKIEEDGRTAYEVTFKAVKQPTVWWALQYADCVEVVRPPGLRDDIAKSVRMLQGKYLEKPKKRS